MCQITFLFVIVIKIAHTIPEAEKRQKGEKDVIVIQFQSADTHFIEIKSPDYLKQMETDLYIHMQQANIHQTFDLINTSFIFNVRSTSCNRTIQPQLQ